MKLEEIQKLCDEATPGPWRWDYTGSSDYWLTSNDERIDGLWDRHDFNEHNRQFIAASRDLLPKLLAVAWAAKRFIEVDYENFPEDVDQCQISNLDYYLKELEK